MAGDRQILSKDWIDRTQIGRGRSRWGSDREYGYGFWIRQFGDHDSYYAWGYGGQFIFIIPERDLVVVTTSRADVSDASGASISTASTAWSATCLTLY